MLQSIRDRSSGLIAKFIVGLIAITFVITGVNFFVTDDGETVIDTVGTVEITERQFVEALDRERREALQIVGDPAAIDENLLRNSVMRALIDDAALVSYANDLGYSVSDAQLDAVIVQIPQFQIDGRFDAGAYDRALGQLGLSRLGFRDELRRNLLRYQVQGAVEVSSFVLPSEVMRLSELQNQTRSGLFVEIPVEPLVADSQVNESEIQAYYAREQSRYQAPARIDVDYVTLDAGHFLADVMVTDADIESAYGVEVDALRGRLERRARHILFGGDDAMTRAEAAVAALVSGAVFAEIAREQSDDIASRESGGDLGFAPAGTYAPEFEAALDQLAIGERSKPVQTPFGVHLIELLESRAEPIPSLAERSPMLREELREAAATRALQERIEEFANIAFSGSLTELRDVFGVEVISVADVPESGGSGLLASPAFIRRAFADDQRASELNADAFEVEPGVFMTFRVRNYREAAPRPLDEVRDEIIADLGREKALEAARAIAEDAIVKMRDMQSNDELGTILGRPVFVAQDVPRMGNEQVTASRSRILFDIPMTSDGSPAYGVSDIGGNTVVAARIDSLGVAPVDEELRVDVQDALVRYRASQEAGEYWSDLRNTLRSTR